MSFLYRFIVLFFVGVSIHFGLPKSVSAAENLLRSAHFSPRTAPDIGWVREHILVSPQSADGYDEAKTAATVTNAHTGKRHSLRYTGIPVAPAQRYIYKQQLKHVSGSGSILVLGSNTSTAVQFDFRSDGSVSPVVTRGSPHYVGWEPAGNGFIDVMVGLYGPPDGKVSVSTVFLSRENTLNHSRSFEWLHDGAWFYRTDRTSAISYIDLLPSGQLVTLRRIDKTPVIVGPALTGASRLLMYGTGGQSLSISSTTASAELLVAGARHPTSVLTFPVGPNGFNNGAAFDLGRLQPGENSKTKNKGGTIGDSASLHWAYSVAAQQSERPLGPEPTVVVNWGVGGQNIADLSKGGKSNSWRNFDAQLAAFVERAADLEMLPFVDWIRWNQGEANEITPRTEYFRQASEIFDSYVAASMQATGQKREPKIIIEQIGPA